MTSVYELNLRLLSQQRSFEQLKTRVANIEKNVKKLLSIATLQAINGRRDSSDFTNAILECPDGSELHFNHDGCPECTNDESST